MTSLLQSAYLKVCHLVKREEGQNLVEYALMIVLVSLACVGGVQQVASAINTVFTSISATLS